MTSDRVEAQRGALSGRVAYAARRAGFRSASEWPRAARELARRPQEGDEMGRAIPGAISFRYRRMEVGDVSGQGYNGRGRKAETMAKRLKALRDPEAARALMAGKRPKGYPPRNDGAGQ